MKYHKRFRNIHRTVVGATRDLVLAKPWRASREDQIELAQHWLEVAAEAYGITTPEFALLDDAMDMELYALTLMMQGGGACNPDGTIRLSHFSVVTLAHEFRHWLQISKPDMPLLIGERGQLVDAYSGEVCPEAVAVEVDGIPLTVIEGHDNEMEEAAQVIAASRCVSAEEIDARAWSISLFCQVAPKRFRNMVRQGRILFVDPEDVLTR